MAKFDFYLTQLMARVVTIDAEDQPQAFQAVEDELYFNVNISNDFEEGGGVAVSEVVKGDTGETVWDDGDEWPE
jgi:hypothetical protein